MAFKQTFERNLNNDMQGDDGQPGRAPVEMEDVDLDIKKGTWSPPQEEFNDSKEQPPRFSTLYGVSPAPKPSPPSASPPPPPPPPPPPQQTYDYHRDYYGPPPRTRRSGVTIPMPLFIVLAILFTLMSLIIFAYTIIGLYNNAPSRVFPWAGPGTATAVCNPGDQQPSINFAPNFVMPQADKDSLKASVETVTVSATPSTITISATPSTTTVSASSSTSSVDPSAAVTGILGALAGLLPSESSASASSAVVTVRPTQSTVTSVQLVTKDPSGNVISGSMVTLTSVTVVPGATSTASITSRAEAEASTLATITSGSSTGVTTGWTAVSSALDSE